MSASALVDVELDEVQTTLLAAIGERRGMSLSEVVGEAVVVYVEERRRLEKVTTNRGSD